MEIQEDFSELLKLFNKNEVKFIIVGGYALAFHGAPRYTGDIDLYVKPEKDNAACVITSLKEFGFGDLGLKQSDFTLPGNVVQLGVPPVRIDIVTSISGVTWDEAYSAKINANYGNVNVNYLGRKEIIANKKSIGRKKDLADLEALDVD